MIICRRMVAIAERPSISERVEAQPSVQPTPRRTLEEAWIAFREKQDQQLLDASLRRFSAVDQEDQTSGEKEMGTLPILAGINNGPTPTNEELRARREAIGISQKMLAEIMPGGKRTTIAEIERGVRNSESTRRKIGNVLSVLEQLDIVPVSISF